MTGEVEIEIYFPIGSHFGGELVTEDKGSIGVMFVIPVEGDEFSQRYVVLAEFADRQFKLVLSWSPSDGDERFHGMSSMAKPLTLGSTLFMGLRMNKPVFTTKPFLLAAT